MEVAAGTNVAAHFMAGYESNLETYLAARTSWLWRKAVFIVRIVVKLNRTGKLRRLGGEHSSARRTDINSFAIAMGTNHSHAK